MIHLSALFFLVLVSTTIFFRFRRRRIAHAKAAPRLQAFWRDLSLGIFEQSEAGAEDRLGLALKAGLGRLDMTHGLIGLHAGTQCNLLRAVNKHYSAMIPAAEGQSIDRKNIFCGQLGESRQSLLIDSASLSEWRSHPAYEKLGWECYIGAYAPLAGGGYITVSFFQPVSRNQLFTRADKEFVVQAARWVAAMVEKKERADAASAPEYGPSRPILSTLDSPSDTISTFTQNNSSN
jgi:hypothetical protein